MNTEDDNEDNLSTTKSVTEPIAKSESLESREEALPSNTAEDGSGDHLPTVGTKNTTSERIPDCVTRNLTEDISEKPKKVCDKDIRRNAEKSQQDTLVSKVKEQTATSTDTLEDDILVLSKSTCLETNSSKVSEELDSENQDEDLVLRWDDDEGDGSRSFKDDEVDKVDQVRDKSMEDLTLNHGPGTEKSQVLTKESTERMDTDLDSVSEKIEITLNNSTEVLDIDLDEVTQKFEESLKESSEDPDTHLDHVSAKPEQAQQESAEIAKMVIVNDSVKFEETVKENTKVVISDINQDHTASKPPQEKPELTESAEISDPELGSENLKTPKSPGTCFNQDAENTQKETIEIPEIDEDAEMTEVMQKEPAAIDLDPDLEPSEVTEKVSGENDDKDNFDQSKVAGMECVEGIELKTSDDEVEEDQDDLLSEIDAQIAELGASLSKAENDKLVNIKTFHKTKTTATKDSNIFVSSSSPLEKVISIDTNEEIDKIATKDTQDEIVQHSQSQKETSDMDIEDALLADDPDLSIDQNEKDHSPNNSEVLANSTKLDHSFIGDSEMDSACKDDTFAHDSSSSIDGRVHGVNKTNVMLEIPTQELLDLDSLSCESMSGKEMSLDEIKTEEGNVSVDLTDDKDPAEKITKESDEEKPLGENQMNKKVTLESETILNESNLDIGKLTKEDCISKEKVTDTDVEMKIVQEPEVVQKEIEPPETTKEENLHIDNQPKAGTSATNNTMTIETKANSTTVNSLFEDTSTNIDRDIIDVQPSTSQTGLSAQDPSDDAAEVAEVTDSLGLLAESSFVREDDDGDVDDQETSDHEDDDDDFDPDDESSNQQEHSEDSTHHSETDTSKPQTTTKTVTDKHFGIITNKTDVEVTVTKDTGEAIKKDETAKDVSMDIGETIVQDAMDLAEQDANVDQDTTSVDEATTEFIDQARNNVDQDTTDVVDQGTEDKEFAFEISNVVSQDDGKDADVTEGIDIDDAIVCGEVEVTENDPDGDRPTEVDVSALQSMPEDNGSNAMPFKVHTESKLRELLNKETAEQAKSPKKKLKIAQPSHEISIVDLESSSDDEGTPKPTQKSDDTTSINISKEIEVMSSGDNISEILSKEGETIINVPKNTAALQKFKSRLNTSEITIKTASPSDSPTLVIPEAKMGEPLEAAKPKFGGLEVFNLDSDEEDTSPAPPPRDPTPEPSESPPPEPHAPEKPPSKCINSACSGDPSVPLFPADPSVAAYYDCHKKKRAMVCEICLYEKVERSQKLIEGIRNFTPLLDIEEVRSTQELVEISDSESDDDNVTDDSALNKIGPDNIPMLEQQLSEILNATWERFKMDARLEEVKDSLHAELEHLEKESIEVNAMLDSCQLATDKLRSDLYAAFDVERHHLPGLVIHDMPDKYTIDSCRVKLRSDLYATFDVERHHLPGLVIHDMPDKYYICPEAKAEAQQLNEVSNKRRLSSASESQAKKLATPLATTGPDKKEVTVKTETPTAEDLKATDTSKLDDDKDISVVQLSAESAPADLPPPGEAVRPPLQPHQTVFAMRHAFGSWIKARVLEVTPKGTSATAQNFTMCRVKFENKTSRNAYKLLPARCLAYFEPPTVRMTIGTRVVALFKDTSSDKSGKKESFYSGVVAEVPNPVNKYRYLVFFDDGYAQYVCHTDTRLVCEFSNLVWEEVHPFSREFVKEYLIAYPERPMVRLHTGQSLKTEWNGKWWLSRVLQVDASLAQVYFEQDKRSEWIYRGSTRLAPLYLELQAAEKHRARPLPRNRLQNKLNMPYVEYTRLGEQDEQQGGDKPTSDAQGKAQQEAEIRRQRAVAKKSTAPANQPPAPAPPAANLDAVTSRVVYYTPKNAVKPYKMSTHTCGVKCRRTDVLALKDLRTYNPLAKPLLSGWERQIVRYKGHKEVMYRAPCGRRLRNMAELHRYLTTINSDMGVDLFDFGPNTHCLAEFVLNKCIVGKKDLSHGKENVPVPCVNYYDNSLPEFCSYNTERTPTAGVPLCLEPGFLCGCDCTDDCQDKSKCACWKMTLEGARTIGLDDDVGYVYKRLPEPLPSGIYECNSRCKCKQTCLNRVAQHPLQLKLQVFKTLNRGWGIRALNDVPKGSFLCIYAGNLLTDATANLDGLNEGDEYLAELDYIEVVEQMKEGYEDDIPEHDKKLDRKESGQAESSEEESESEEEEKNSKSDAEDGDFEPGYIPGGLTGFSKRLRKRDKKKQKDAENKQKEKDSNKEGGEDDCITISDDEELREPSSFAAQAGMGGAFISKYRSVRTLFGRDEACYIMDAKVQGNIGRYLNHSCSPNVFVQNVFVDTHDPRFPWVAFFALSHIRAGTELTWNYNYDVGSVPGKALYCYCGAPNCRGRLL